MGGFCPTPPKLMKKRKQMPNSSHEPRPRKRRKLNNVSGKLFKGSCTLSLKELSGNEVFMKSESQSMLNNDIKSCQTFEERISLHCNKEIKFNLEPKNENYTYKKFWVDLATYAYKDIKYSRPLHDKFSKYQPEIKTKSNAKIITTKPKNKRRKRYRKKQTETNEDDNLPNILTHLCSAELVQITQNKKVRSWVDELNDVLQGKKYKRETNKAYESQK